MSIEVLEESRPVLAEYARISIAFEVREVADVVESRSHAGRFVPGAARDRGALCEGLR